MSENSNNPPARKRVVHWFKIPEQLWPESGGVKKLGFVELTANEELFATKRCMGDVARLVFELARESLRYVEDANGVRTIYTSDDSVDLLWGSFHPSIRNTALSAYNKLHSTKPEQMASFLDSREVTTV